MQVEKIVQKEEGGDPSPASLLSAVSLMGSKEECSRHWKRFVMDRGLAKIQGLIQKFFATAVPADIASASSACVRVPDRRYMSAAKRAIKQAAKKKNTPFTVVSSHQNKMGLTGIRPAVPEKHLLLAAAAAPGTFTGAKGKNGKRVYAGEENQQNTKKCIPIQS